MKQKVTHSHTCNWQSHYLASVIFLSTFILILSWVLKFWMIPNENILYVQHSGIFHVALGCWVLLTFGPQVCRGYGSFTFFLIYILGGISGNLTSFLHTPDLTVGGTVSNIPLSLYFFLFLLPGLGCRQYINTSHFNMISMHIS